MGGGRADQRAGLMPRSTRGAGAHTTWLAACHWPSTQRAAPDWCYNATTTTRARRRRRVGRATTGKRRRLCDRHQRRPLCITPVAFTRQGAQRRSIKKQAAQHDRAARRSHATASWCQAIAVLRIGHWPTLQTHAIRKRWCWVRCHQRKAPFSRQRARHDRAGGGHWHAWVVTACCLRGSWSSPCAALFICQI